MAKVSAPPQSWRVEEKCQLAVMSLAYPRESRRNRGIKTILRQPAGIAGQGIRKMRKKSRSYVVRDEELSRECLDDTRVH